MYEYFPGKRRTNLHQTEARKTNAREEGTGLYTAYWQICKGLVSSITPPSFSPYLYISVPCLALLFSMSDRLTVVQKLTTVKDGWTQILLSAEMFSSRAEITFQSSVLGRMELVKLKRYISVRLACHSFQCVWPSVGLSALLASATYK